MARTDPKVFTPILPRDGGIRLSDAEILGHAAISAGDLHSYIRAGCSDGPKRECLRRSAICLESTEYSKTTWLL